ncbi:sigma factor-like helix-turn-helix DNA-binding protein [Lentzea sp. NPDC058436]|uniref:sigma factor-like helix-turn-helix DNA-binding protein n=1 Tax=Lentzea sp. NPDC058436 TaxID=3346499 RepID=UPI0036683BF6
MNARKSRPAGASLVADALSALEPEHRVVVVRACYRGESVAEVSDALGLPRDTVKTRLQHGLHALRLALQENGVIEP